MKFKTFDFEGTKIRVGLIGDDIVMVAEDMQRLFGYGFGAFGTPRMLRAVAETGLPFPHVFPRTSPSSQY